MAANILKDKSQENNTGHINMAALDSADILRDTSFASCDFPANSTHNKRSYDANVFDILKVPPEDFASQITLMYLSVFKKIEPEELISCAWNNKDKLEKAPNIVAFTQCFNHVNFWVQGEILKAESVRLRADILAHFIKIAKKLFEKQNLHGVKAVISALQSAPIYRLSNTWALMAQKEKRNFEKLAELFSEESNRANLRQYLNNAKNDCIPYLGLYLFDLVYIDVAHPHSGGLDKEPRRSAINNILRTLADFQQSSYSNLQPLEHIQSYFKDVRYIEELQKFVEDENFKKSLVLEPGQEATESQSGYHSSTLNSRHSADDLVTSNTPCQKERDAAHTMPAKLTAAYAQGQRHLLDDSELAPSCSTSKSDDIENEKSDSEFESLRSTSCFPRSRKNSSRREWKCDTDDVCKEISMEGVAKRKVLLKDGKRPMMVSWETYWLALAGSSLFYFPHKSLRLSKNRKHFKKNACNISKIAGWNVMPLEQNVFQIYNGKEGHLIKFKFDNVEEKNRWMEATKAACAQDNQDEDLIDLC